jgi:diadenosine tetraphosphate (Ap4A) HIT family hydrolase
VARSEWFAFAIADRFPVSPGHALVIPRRFITSWWEATDQERADMLALIDEV